MGAQAWPFGCLCLGPDCLGCGTRFAQTVLAPISASGLGRSRRLEAPWIWRHGMARLRLPTTTTGFLALLGLTAAARGVVRSSFARSGLEAFMVFLFALFLFAGGVAEAASLSGRALVLDGDTLILSGERIRLLGIDAPELSQMCLDADGHCSPCGRVAAEALIARIGVSPISCVGDTRDRYGRLLATCFLGDLDLHGWLVLQGYALAYREYSMRYVPEEDEAWAGREVSQFEKP